MNYILLLYEKLIIIKNKNMEAKKIKSSYLDELVITGDVIVVTNSFGDTYKRQSEDNKVVAKTQISLSYLTRAYSEYKNSLQSIN
jgi:hypothetical protein